MCMSVMGIISHCKTMSKEQVKLFQDLWHDLMLLVRKPKQPSLLAEGISWCSNVPWVPRLEAYQQTEDWISIKHTNHENTLG